MLKLRGDRRRDAEMTAMLDAVGRSQAVIEFDTKGNILSANRNFLDALGGYEEDEVVGRHHAIFVAPEERETGAYRDFWAALAEGEFRAGEFRRIARDGSEVWIQATYNPIFGSDARPYKVIKIASDITAQKRVAADHAGQVSAISRSQAVIEFALDGTILTANENFLAAMGYRLDEIAGQHHSMFVEPADRKSAAYLAFWDDLRAGTFKSGEFRRVGKDGRDVWIQATYTPIADASGRPCKVVKFATDITEAKLRNADYAGQVAAIARTQAVIEFDLDGTIRQANDIFLQAMGYASDEVVGRHHSMFVDPDEAGGDEYRAFWAALNQGEHRTGEFRRLGRDGREVWIQATYTPILDAEGRPFKVVKFASDITAQVVARKRSEHVRELMESVAAGAERLNLSVREISESMVRSRSSAENAVELVADTDTSTERLSDAAQSMGGIVDAIDAITAKITLLALNASIESARAGDAGRGFAVVANEVKVLANQAKAATEQIAQEIESMRGVSGDVVAGLTAIREAIEEVREYVAGSTSAIEQQSDVANDMSAAMQRASEEAAAIG